MMYKHFKGKVAVITGAASGIGRGLATELAAAGARLALTDVNVAGLAETRRLCGDAECRTYEIDVASREQMFEFKHRNLRQWERRRCPHRRHSWEQRPVSGAENRTPARS